jgi:hypothetical protein
MNTYFFDSNKTMSSHFLSWLIGCSHQKNLIQKNSLIPAIVWYPFLAWANNSLEGGWVSCV